MIHYSNKCIFQKIKIEITLLFSEEKCFYLVCLVKCGERVLASNLITTARSIHDHNKITFPNTLTLEGLYSDFKVTIEVYTITGRNKEVIPHDIKYHISTNKRVSVICTTH